MKHLSKSYNKRLEQLLDTALLLFIQKGYEKTSVQNIINTIDIAKGTFYHYFKSKEDLLEQLIDRETAKIMGPIHELIQQENLNALEKLNLIFKIAGMKKIENRETILVITRTLFSDANLKFRHKSQEKSHSLLIPEYTKIIEQGIQEKIFNTLPAQEAAELIVSLSSALSEALVPLFLETLEHPENSDQIASKLHTYEYAIERILGLPKGSIQIMNREILELFISDRKETQ